MYLIEWGLWQASIEPEPRRKATDAEATANDTYAIKDFYESDLKEEIHFNSVSNTPRTRGPVFSFNDTYMDMRCGGTEEKRGLITLATLGGIAPMIFTATLLALGFIWIDITDPAMRSPISMLTTLIMLSLDAAIIYLYSKYGFHLTRLEIITSRHLLIRFNRKTQQVHLHRPSYCGGIVTFPWKTTASTATYPEDDACSLGVRLGLIWHPSRTGLPHMEVAFLGKQGQGGSELRDEWEFIRRYMEEGPESVPRPRLSTQLPSPIRAFSAQFEGLGRFFRKSSWLLKAILLMVWPAFVIIGTAHWVSLMLCWRPHWPKVIREAGMPGKPVPPLTTLSDYPSEIQKRLLANADRWRLKPGKRP
ncbi:hypothetical protein NJF44_25165 [Pseudomonas guariconensis]|uniref:DUF6708 domain-containing protein n=1 Tax=Pseudomonas TaxID=286 RepID=UPI002097957B|nr:MULTISPECIES: DUF6708 domain-containing protein [Pseudomonas]MCO7643682.1 hypothetical protein [Pseudomonas sp. S 311-6]MCO7518021.1 hypothetical protein [Pseudomonas putida]MCO7568240.1 hypothetical protein [Pseudomonas mosselii]MCO7597488.1 hypothetical protein [Pseudomonas guariconensis]MCO7608525.1 hypothetical protein [Pseudomonas guariconensis]